MNDPLPVSAPVSAEDDEPPSWLKKLFNKWLRRMHSKPEIAALHEAVDDLISGPSGQNGVPTAERVILDNVLSLRDKEVVDCMVPRAQIVAIGADSEMKDLIALMAEHAHSRIPAYRETLDDTIGMVHMKDVLACLSKDKACRIRDLLRPVFFVAPSMPATKLLLQMRQARQHMAMVVDEFGGVDGLVTIEDLVEEIVGEIDDEHDIPPPPEMITRPDGTLLVDAGMDIENLEAHVGVLLTDEERETIDTVAGYVFHLAGHVPSIGETVEGKGGIMFDVLETDMTRIKRLRVRGAKRKGG